jgi:hypothetical protein
MMTAAERKFVKFMSGKYPWVISIAVPAAMGSIAMLLTKNATDRAPFFIAVVLTFVVIIARSIAHYYAAKLVADETRKSRKN